MHHETYATKGDFGPGSRSYSTKHQTCMSVTPCKTHSHHIGVSVRVAIEKKRKNSRSRLVTYAYRVVLTEVCAKNSSYARALYNYAHTQI